MSQIASISVSDLTNGAGPTSGAPCSPAALCREADKQGLAGCDAATGECVCQRGYALTVGICTGTLLLGFFV